MKINPIILTKIEFIRYASKESNIKKNNFIKFNGECIYDNFKFSPTKYSVSETLKLKRLLVIFSK